MPIRKLRAPMRYAGDKEGPFADEGLLRVLIDLPADLRQVEAGRWEGPTAPVPDHVLWGLCRSKDVEVYWLAGPDESGVGAVHLQEPDPAHDQWPYTFTKADGRLCMGANSFHRQLLHFAGNDPARPVETLAKAALSQDLRAHITVTNDPKCSTSPGPTPATAT